MREKRHALGIRPVFKRVDTCAAEFGTNTAYLYSTTALLIGAALRLLSMGQMEGQRALWALHPVIERVAREAAARDAADLWSFAPGIEIAGIRHAALEMRLFRS